MSKAKFAAAKELIEEGSYDEARAILRKIDHPTASKWLRQIDKIDPPFPEHAPQSAMSEIEKYYKRKNRSTPIDVFVDNLRFIAGITGGIFMLLISAYWYHLSAQTQSGLVIFYSARMSLVTGVLGILTIIAFGVWWGIKRKK